MTGTVTRIFLTKGYGFIMGEDGQPYFLHATDCHASQQWEQIHGGMTVDFEPSQSGDKGNKLRAKDVRVQRALHDHL